MSLTLTIGGSNFLPQYRTNSAKIKEILQNRSNTANLVITKKSSQSAPQEGQEIIFKDNFIIDSYSKSNQNYYDNVYGTKGGGLKGQSFIGNGGTLDKCKFYLKKTGSPTGNAVAKIYAHTGTYGTDGIPTGAVLATSNVFDISTLTGDFALTDFTFTGAEKITLTNGTHYCIIFEYTGGDAGANYAVIGLDTSSPTHSGNKIYYTFSGWTADNSQDICFYVYTERFLFAGFVSRISPVEIGEGELFIYRTELMDYTYVLINKNAQKSYENRTLKYIVEDLISTYVDSGYSITTTNVDTGPTIDTIAFDHINLKKCFEKLAKITGYEWYIDFEKDIHFKDKETVPAPEGITDTSDNFINIGIKYDTAQVRNYVIVQGGIEKTASYFSQKFLGDGKAREFILREKPRDMEFIKLNAVSKNFGVDPLDEETGNYFMFNFQEKYIRVIDSEPVPGLTDEIEASYKYDVPVIVLLKSASSIETMKDIEGGDGIHSFSIVDSSIKSKAEARQRALKELLEFANPLVNAIFTTRTGLLTAGSYFKPGQELTINLPSWNINTDTKYLIQEVETTLVEDGSNIEYNYKVRFGGRLLDIIALLDGIAGKEDILKDTQEIDRIEAISEELSIAEVITRDGNLQSIAESLSIAEVIDETIVTPPFKWSPYAINPDLAMKWNKFEWS